MGYLLVCLSAAAYVVACIVLYRADARSAAREAAAREAARVALFADRTPPTIRWTPPVTFR